MANKRIMLYLIFLAVSCLLFFISCDRQRLKKHKECSLESKSNKDSNCFVNYYPEGKIKEKGVYKDSIKVGLWNEWYNDGDLKWSGHYDKNNERKIEISQQTPLLVFLKETGKLKINKRYDAKVKVNGLHPKDMILSTKNKVSMTFNHDSDYYSFTFKDKGAIIIKVYAVYFSEDYFVGEISLTID